MVVFRQNMSKCNLEENIVGLKQTLECFNCLVVEWKRLTNKERNAEKEESCTWRPGHDWNFSEKKWKHL